MDGGTPTADSVKSGRGSLPASPQTACPLYRSHIAADLRGRKVMRRGGGVDGHPRRGGRGRGGGVPAAPYGADGGGTDDTATVGVNAILFAPTVRSKIDESRAGRMCLLGNRPSTIPTGIIGVYTGWPTAVAPASLPAVLGGPAVPHGYRTAQGVAKLTTDGGRARGSDGGQGVGTVSLEVLI